MSALDALLEARDSSAGDSHRNVKCPKCGMVQSATHTSCSSCGHALDAARRGKFANAQEAAPAGADGPLRENKQGTSMAKASTPEPVGKGGPLWKLPGLHLPPYIQHVANDLIPTHGEQKAIEMAVGIVKNWRDGHDGHGNKVTADTQAAASKAIAEWEADKAKRHAATAAKKAAGGSGGNGRVRESVVDEQAIAAGCAARLAVLEEQLGLERLVEAAAKPAGWSPQLVKTASAASEDERYEVHDEGQHVGYVAKRRGYLGGGKRGDAWHARALNGDRLGDYDGATDRAGALERLRSHLAEGPARVAKLGPKWLVAEPGTYGSDSYRTAPSEPIARHMAGLPPKPSTPESASRVSSLAESALIDAQILAVFEGQALPLSAMLQERKVPQSKREQLAKKGQAIRNADGSVAYPIETVSDLQNAATLARSGHGNVAAARKLIAKMAKKLGVPNPLDGSAQESAPGGIGALVEAAHPVPLG